MKIIWIDDDARDDSLKRIWDGIRFVAGAEGLGESGDADAALRCIDVEHFLLESEKGKFDLAVIDYKIPPTTGEHVATRLLAKHPGIRIIFLSAWLSQFDPTRNLDPRAAFVTLEKPTATESEASWFARLEDAVRTVFSKPVYDCASDNLVRVPDDEELVAIDRNSLDELPFDQQMEVVHELTAVVEESFDDVFVTTSAAWLLITWPTAAIVRWGNLEDPLPTEEERQDIEDSYEEISLVVGRPLEVGEIGGSWSACRKGPVGHPDLYPSIRVELPGWDGFVNVDTGSVATFISYEDLSDSPGVTWLPKRTRYNWSRERIKVGPARRGFTASSAVVDKQAEVDSRDGTVSIALQLRILDPFYGTGLARSCSAGECEGSTERGDALYWCGHRRGLIGRDILRLNGVRLVFDSVMQRCYVEVDTRSDGVAVSEQSRGSGSFLVFGSDSD